MHCRFSYASTMSLAALLLVFACADLRAVDLSRFPPIIQGQYLGGQTLAIDSAGNRYVAGSFNGTKEFNPGGTSAMKTSAGGEDVCVTRFNADGTWKWTQTFGGTNDEYAFAIAVSADATKVYVAGKYNSINAKIGSTGVVVPKVAPGLNNSAFVFALNATDGTPVTTFGISPSGVQVIGSSVAGAEAFADGIAVTASTLYVCGGFTTQIQFNGAGTAVQSMGSQDCMVFALNAATGAAVTTFGLGSSGIQKFGGTGFEDTYGIAINPAGTSLFVTGNFASTDAQIGGTGAKVSTSGGADAYLIKLSASTGLADTAFGLVGTGAAPTGIQKFAVARAIPSMPGLRFNRATTSAPLSRSTPLATSSTWLAISPAATPGSAAQELSGKRLMAWTTAMLPRSMPPRARRLRPLATAACRPLAAAGRTKRIR